jgi:hypothetical protein
LKHKALVFLACAAVTIILCTTIVSAASQRYFSSVHFAGKLTGKVGDHFETNIKYEIGWASTAPGPVNITRSAVNNPEYEIFANSLPAGLRFHSDTGVLEGTPQESGVWHLTPAVRDRDNGEKPYRGNGFWFTDFTTYQGKTWIEAKTPTDLEIAR